MTKKDLKIVFLGTPDFAVESLRRMVEGGYNVVGVVTMPDKPAGRGHKLYQSPVKEFAVAHGLKLMQPVKLKDPDFVNELRSLDADLFVVIAFRMLPEVVWTMPRLGTFNLHASLLPRYRGAAPINWAVINGDTETGVTTFFLKHEIDTGDIIAQERIEILPTDNVGNVHDKLMELGAELTIKTCRIDWSAPAITIHNLVRGLSPYPAAWSTLEDNGVEIGAVKIFETRVIPSNNHSSYPGKISVEDNRIIVCTGDTENDIEILSLQAPGKRRMPTADFLRGSRLSSPHFQ